MGPFLAIIRTKISVRLEVSPWFTGNTRVQVPARNGKRKAMIIWMKTLGPGPCKWFPVHPWKTRQFMGLHL